MLPAAGVFDGFFAPDAGGAVEVDEASGAVAGGVFDHEVAIEEDGLAAGEEGLLAVDVVPAGLDAADVGVGEEVYGFAKHVGVGDEVGIEDGDEFTGGGGHAGGECAGFIALAVGAVDVEDVVAQAAHAVAGFAGDVGGFIGGVIEDLDLEFVARVVDLAGGFDDAFGDVFFVVHGELDGDAGEVGEFAGRNRGFAVVLVIQIDLQVTV